HAQQSLAKARGLQFTRQLPSPLLFTLRCVPSGKQSLRGVEEPYPSPGTTAAQIPALSRESSQARIRFRTDRIRWSRAQNLVNIPRQEVQRPVAEGEPPPKIRRHTRLARRSVARRCKTILLRARRSLHTRSGRPQTAIFPLSASRSRRRRLAAAIHSAGA